MTKEMSRKQFHASLKRYGLRQVLLWIECPAKPDRFVGIMCWRNGNTAYRATLAKAIREFEVEPTL